MCLVLNLSFFVDNKWFKCFGCVIASRSSKFIAMKKTIYKIAMAALAVVLTNQVSAQNFSIGAKGGASINSFSEFPYDEIQPGYNAGVFGWYSSESRWAVGGDLTYRQTGGEYERTFIGLPTNSPEETRLNYVSLAPRIGFFLNDFDSKWRPKVTVGPTIGYLLNADDIPGDFNIENEIKDWNFGAVAGIGLNYEVAQAIWINADVDYNFGINNISTASNTIPERLTNQGLGINLGVAFGLGEDTFE